MTEPRRGIHAPRIPGLDVALLDVAGTLLGAAVLARVARAPVALVFMLLLVLSVPVHRAFGVQTRVVEVLYGCDP